MAFVVVVGALIGAYNLISTAVKNRREQTAQRNLPLNEVREDIRKHGEMLDRDKRRLDKIEEILDSQNEKDAEISEGLYILMRGFLAMTRHIRHGNNVDGLDKTEEEITNFLTK